MANQEHLDTMKQGTDAWNSWRRQHPNVIPDLSRADLSRANLKGANLKGANLKGANLRGQDLRRQDLSGTDLSGANLSGTDLSGQVLSYKDLSEANLKGANLKGANLRGQDLGHKDLSGTNLSGADLSGADLRGTNLSEANLSGADLRGANLSGADLSGANLNKATLRGDNPYRPYKADLREADLREADLREADLSGVDLRGADLSKANLCGQDLRHQDLSGTNLSGADLSGADLSGQDLSHKNLSEANLSGANLSRTLLIGTNFTEARLNDCTIYGIAAWNVQLDKATQKNLIITSEGEAIITIDNLKVAQFIYLLLNNAEIGEVINTLTTKSVLILGRFTPERKAVLDALRDALRDNNFLPILFDFDPTKTQTVRETVRTLAHLSHFIIADLTNPGSIPEELETIIPTLAVPIQPLLELTQKREFSMFKGYGIYSWVLPIYRYTDLEGLINNIKAKVIEPATKKAQELTDQKVRLNQEPFGQTL